MADRQVGESDQPIMPGVQAGQVVELLAAGAQEGVAHLDADLLQRLQAVDGKTRAHHVDFSDATPREVDQRGLGVGLQPLGLAEAALERDDKVIGTETQLLRHQPRRLQALAVIRVAEQQGAPGHAMKAQHQLVRTAVRLPMFSDAVGQGVDVARVVVIVVHNAQLGQRTNASGPVAERVDHAGRGGPRILRVQRQHEDAIDVLRLELVEHAGHRRVAVAHREAHRHVVATLTEVATQHLRLFVGPCQQR